MGFTLAPLLIYSEFVPQQAREALKAAIRAPIDERVSELESAARILYLETPLDCRDAREIVGLHGGGTCG